MSSRKPRPDSLYARLAAADPSLALREWVFYAAIVEGKGLEEIGGTLHDKGVSTSETAIGEMIQRHALRWKLDRSSEAAREVDKWQPDKKGGTLDQQLRRNIKKRLFDATMGELSVKEMVAIRRTNIAERALEIQLFDIQTECASIIAEVLRGEARAEELRAVAKDRNLTGREFIEAIRQRVYGPAAAARPGKEDA
ncbi:MAG: hypothetical protein V4726_00900 [Verrucomicrobiota bacterium]